MYKCKYFKIKELVHPNLLRTISEEVLWMMLDDRLLRCADIIREHHGPITINGNGLVDCGLREQNSSTGAIYSAHKMGRALDLHIMSIEIRGLRMDEKIKEYNEVRQHLINNSLSYGGASFCRTNKENSLINTLSFENNISWLHIDTYNRERKLFNP